MSTTFLDFNQQSDIGRKITRALGLIREGRDVLRDALAIAETMKVAESNGNDPAHWQQFAMEAGFEGEDQPAKNAAAMSSFNELASLNFKLNIAGAHEATQQERELGLVDNIGPSITQACAKHGV